MRDCPVLVPSLSRRRRAERLVEALGDGLLEPWEQAPVGVPGHRDRRVTEPLPDCQRVGAVRDGQRRSGVAQLVEPELADLSHTPSTTRAGSSSAGGPRPWAPGMRVRRTERPAWRSARRGRRSGTPAGSLCECRRVSSAARTRRGRRAQAAGDRRGRFVAGGPRGPGQADEPAPPQADVRCGEDHGAVGLRVGRDEHRDLRGLEEPHPPRPLRRQLHAADRVARDPTILHGGLEDRAEDDRVTPNGAPGQLRRGEFLGHHGSDVGRPDLREGEAAEPGEQVVPGDTEVQFASGWPHRLERGRARPSWANWPRTSPSSTDAFIGGWPTSAGGRRRPGMRPPNESAFCAGCGLPEKLNDRGLCVNCASFGAAEPADPFTGEEMHKLLSEFFGTDKPMLNAGDPDLEAVSQEAWNVLRQSNIDPVSIFRVGGIPSRLEFDDTGAPVVRILTTARLRQEMAARATWFRSPVPLDALAELIQGDPENKLLAKLAAVRPPKDVIENMLAMPDIFLPVLERIVEAPVFAPDGTIETSPGYHAGSRTYYAGRGLKLRRVSDDPTVTEVDEAVSLVAELLRDFPFVTEADPLTAMAAMLGPFVRSLIDGSTPLHLIEAPTPGTGKGLLADVIAIPATGRRAATITEARGEEEWRKRITAVLRNGRPVTMIDNIQARLDSAALSAAITSPLWTDRLLGATEIIAYPMTTVWLATGNNPALSQRRPLLLR